MLFTWDTEKHQSEKHELKKKSNVQLTDSSAKKKKLQYALTYYKRHSMQDTLSILVSQGWRDVEERERRERERDTIFHLQIVVGSAVAPINWVNSTNRHKFRH